jgi:hypothetical protein
MKINVVQTYIFFFKNKEKALVLCLYNNSQQIIHIKYV